MFAKVDDTTVWPLISTARSELHNYLAGLTEQQWRSASLCEGWLVADIIAHLILEYQYTASKDWTDFLRSGFRINTFMQCTAVELGKRPASELLDRFEIMIDQQHKPSAVSVLNVLADLLVHEQDIRLALGHDRVMPLAPLRLVFNSWQPVNFNLGEKITGVAARVKGLEFAISDLDIRKGNGMLVEGTAQDILLAIVGRRQSTDRLSGDGVATLRQRLG